MGLKIPCALYSANLNCSVEINTNDPNQYVLSREKEVKRENHCSVQHTGGGRNHSAFKGAAVTSLAI